MNLEKEKQRLSRKYKTGSCRYYLHLLASIFKSIYHNSPSIHNRIEGKRNFIPYIPVGCRIEVFGDDNIIEIDRTVNTFIANIRIGDPDIPVNRCTIKVGKNTSSGGINIHLYEHDSSVFIGKDSVLSFGIEIWASDSHSIIDKKSKKLLNYGKKIVIGDRVWIGMRSIILKNSHITNDCIVGAGSVISGKFTKPHCILAGNPARIVKEEISWDQLRPIQYREK